MDIIKTQMENIAIYGGGGLGREVACLINLINSKTPIWNLIGFFDDGKYKGTEIDRYGRILGGIDEVNSWPEHLNIVLCMGSPKTMETVHRAITNQLITFPNIICPDFFISDKESFQIGMGNIIQGDCAVTTSVNIGNFNILNGGVIIGHDTAIGDYNVFMPGCRISGEVSIGFRNLFGSMSFVKQCLKIGNDITLSPLSPLLNRPKDGFTYIGNPAKIFKF